MTSAFDRSVSKRSAFTNVARSVTAAAFALRFDSSTMSGLYSMPIARAPRFAAVITVRPSPDPRSITKSAFVTFAMSSILSTTACGVGTHTTSLPAWPTCGSNGFCPVAVWANAAPDTIRDKTRIAITRRVLIESSPLIKKTGQSVYVLGLRPPQQVYLRRRRRALANSVKSSVGSQEERAAGDGDRRQ